MQQLTPFAKEAINQLAQRYGVSVHAVTTLLFAVSAGGGSMAQFHHPELGGGGQWMRGGMTMVGDMFNHGLQATVAGLCSELSALLASQQVMVQTPQSSGESGGLSAFGNSGGYGNAWWPAELGNPSSSGGQNDSRYAYFPHSKRLAIEQSGRLSVYDTLDHQLGGVQQQQGGPNGSLSFTSQFGTFTVDSLPLADQRERRDAAAPAPQPSGWRASSQTENDRASPANATFGQSHDEILATLERLSDLHQRGVLSEDEFRNKKADLLSRL